MTNPGEFHCPYCNSTFLEDIGSSSVVLATNAIVNARNMALSEEQSRRLANAAIMLRLLEAQLRDELESLQTGNLDI